MDNVIYGATGVVATLLGILAENWRHSRKNKVDLQVARESSYTEDRRNEIRATIELRDQLRQRVKDQEERIRTLEVELDERRKQRLEFEAERLEWFKQRRELEERVFRMESALRANGITLPDPQHSEVT